MRFVWLPFLLLIFGCRTRQPIVPSECSNGSSTDRECTRVYKRVERIFHSKPRWGLWAEPFRSFEVRDPGHDFDVRAARAHLARWGRDDAGAHAASQLTKVDFGYKRDALQDLFSLGPKASQWLPEVRAFHRRHKGERWGVDVLALVRMGAPEGPGLLREGLLSGRNPEPYLWAGGEELYGGLQHELEQLQQHDPRYGVRLWATFVLRGLTQDGSYKNETISPPTCFTRYERGATSTNVAWDDSTLTLQNFPNPEVSGGLCSHAPWRGKPWAKHVDLLGQCALLYQRNIHPGRVAIYPRDREPYTLFEEHQGMTMLNWNQRTWVVTAHSHHGGRSGGMMRVVKDDAGFLRVDEHIDFGGFPQAYKKERDGSLVVLASVGMVFDSPCAEDEAADLQLIRVRPDLTVESVPSTSTRTGVEAQ